LFLHRRQRHADAAKAIEEQKCGRARDHENRPLLATCRER
jgi:hypothetical protein